MANYDKDGDLDYLMYFKGLKTIKPKSNTAQALINFAKKAKQIPTRGNVPKDFVKNVDYYTWGGKKHGE